MAILHEDQYIFDHMSQFFLEWDKFQTKVVEKSKTYILYLINLFSRKSFRLWDNVEKYCTAGQAIDNNTTHAHCVPDT